METLQKRIEIVNELGLHARAAAVFVREAEKFKSDIMVSKDGFEVNGKSIMGLMMLAAPKGSTIELHVSGEDASNACEKLETLIQDKFGEDR